MASDHYASGDWTVREGQEEEFVARWRDWLSSSAAGAPGFRSASLLRDVEDPRHFISISQWDDPDQRTAWKNTPEFAQGMARVREITEAFRGSDYATVVSI